MKLARRAFLLSATLLALSSTAPAWAQQRYPGKPITIVVAYPAGGETDVIARMFGEKLTARLGQPVVVDNRVGATGIIGTTHVSRAAPDGYTLLLAPNTFTIAQTVLKTPAGSGYDVLNGFTPVIQAGTAPLFLVASAGSGFKSVADAVAASKTREIAYGSPGTGSPMHILGELLNRESGARFRHVPYKGVLPAVNDVVGGHLPLVYTSLGIVAPHFATGKLVPLAVADRQRSPLAPNVPSLQELGYKDIEVSGWYGLYGPKGMPAEVVATLNSHLNEILRMPDVAARMATLGSLPLGGTPESLRTRTAADYERFNGLLKTLNLQAD
ncbi:tripartite tricarboxylate transporter substrate binding protein [Ramlibacter sp. AW1]|uniref:Tripartite tricarboxylate transporter substrate binding protein n=1 Tax=Ramlibacter aurantiacus TaxID=2801330 RepID=A0A937D3D2_9BURK|nr:tripartite tricarboxylate transporter substrate binding protein [Ramlibacter aurantiacus]MBL0419212.1 tripartite tricarboxylate transporter substrate binding protein [Ramlibacter aurantiacus]